MAKIVALVIGLGLAAGCGDGTLGGSGPDGSAPNNAACSALDQCACYAAIDRCQMRTEACWCGDVCGAPIDCVCGGGQFLACEDREITPRAPACTSQLARVQQACAAQPFVQYIADVCPTGNDTCVASCLANLGSCSEINCGFCTVCDCAEPVSPSPFAACLRSCAGSQ